MKKRLSLFLAAIIFVSAFTFYGCQSTSAGSHGSENVPVENNDEINETIKKAEDLRKNGEYLDAIKTIDGTIEKNQDERLKKLREEIIAEYKLNIIPKVNSMVMKYDYSGAKALLDEIYPFVSDDDKEIKKLYETCTAFQELVPYTGPVEHIFFHPLIAYPELAFDGDYISKGFDNYFVTVPEFKRVIEQLYANNYVLIDIRLIYGSDDKGKVTPKKLMLPKGKKPIVLSMDDYNFLKYMRKNGCVHGLALNEEGNVVTYTDSKDGKRTYSDDNEVVPILDRFVKEHPDFSFGGAKGTIALNGYEGALGFPTDEMNAPNYSKNLEAARAVANRLKETGWIFACHSYSHYSPSKRTYEQFKYDVDKWIKEVVPVVGKTDVYIYPFGEQIKAKDPKFQYMLKSGYRIFCGVSSKPYLKFHDNYAVQQRRNIDGISLGDKRLSDILDASKIIDPIRPSYKARNEKK